MTRRRVRHGGETFRTNPTRSGRKSIFGGAVSLRLPSAVTRLIFAAFFLSASAASAMAQSPPARQPIVLHLTETASREVPRDQLHAELGVDVVGVDATKMQAEINRRMEAALRYIKAVPDVAAETSGYSVYQERPDKAPPRWHGNQSVSLTAKNFSALLTLIGTLQHDGLVVRSLVPELSNAARQSAEDGVTDVVLARLKRRAARVAAALGVKVEGYRDLTVGNAAMPPPLPRVMMATAAAASPIVPPAVEAGEAPVSVTVEASILLTPTS